MLGAGGVVVFWILNPSGPTVFIFSGSVEMGPRPPQLVTRC